VDLLTKNGSAQMKLAHASKSSPLSTKKKDKSKKTHKISGLSCQAYGGPSDDIASEMVYWRDIPSDSAFTSPFAKFGPNPKYLTFEPDVAGWNNMRMAMETAVAIA